MSALHQEQLVADLHAVDAGDGGFLVQASKDALSPLAQRRTRGDHLDRAAVLRLRAEVPRGGALAHGVAELATEEDQRGLALRLNLGHERLYQDLAATARLPQIALALFGSSGGEPEGMPRQHRDRRLDHRLPGPELPEQLGHRAGVALLEQNRRRKPGAPRLEVQEVALVEVPADLRDGVAARNLPGGQLVQPAKKRALIFVVVPARAEDEAGAVRGQRVQLPAQRGHAKAETLQRQPQRAVVRGEVGLAGIGRKGDLAHGEDRYHG